MEKCEHTYKYWLLTTEYPPFFGGGISTYCYQTASMLSAEGHSVTVFINDSAITNFVCEQNKNIRIIRFNVNRGHVPDSLGYVASVSYGFAEIVKEFVNNEGRPDIIEAQEYLGIAYYLLQFKHLMYSWCQDIPILLTLHSPSFLYLEYNQVSTFKYPNYFIGEMERFCIQSADMLISPSHYLIRQIESRFVFDQSRLHVIPNPYLAPSLEISGIDKKETGDIIFFGKLSAQKGVFKLLSYFKKLWDEGFAESLYLIGGQDIVYHPENKQMGAVIKNGYKQYIDKRLLILEDKVAPANIPGKIENAKVVIIPSVVDNLPYVVLEMMALGKIVLVSKQGGQAEIVDDGMNGFVFDHEYPETFFSRLEKIFSLTIKEREIISANARMKINSFYTPLIIYEKKIKLVEKAIYEKRIFKKFPFIRNAECEPLVSIDEKEGINNLLSIVIPYYNLGRYIDETIDSIMSVIDVDFEIIIVNDGSTDELSLIKLDKLKQNKKIHVIDTANNGLASARNLGAEKANGQYLAFLDADDKVAKDYYSKAITVLKAYHNVHFVGAWTKYFESSSNVWPTFTPEPPMILVHNLINTSALVYKKNSFLIAGKNDSEMPFNGMEDYESIISLIGKGYKGVVIPEVLFFYRVRKDSMFRSISKTKKLLLYNYVSKKHRDLYASYAFDIFNLLNANGPGLTIDNPSLDHSFSNSFLINNRVAKKFINIVKNNKASKKVALRIYKFLN